MATITVLDSTGATQTVAKVTATGQTTNANSLPVTLASDDIIVAPIGAVTEAAPGTDTASSGLNGRLQRIAQRLTSMIAQLPASLGIKAAASSLSVTQATEDAARHPASLGSKADAASWPVTQSTEDKAIFAATNTKLDTIHTDLTSVNTQLPSIPSGTVQLQITRPANVTLYSANDVLGGVLTFSTGMTSGQRLMIAGADLQAQVAAVPAGMANMRLYLYDATPGSALADNAPWDLPSGDRAAFLGYVDIGTPVDLGSTIFVQTDNINKEIKLNASANLFGYLVTIGSFTPNANSEIYLLRLQMLGL